MGSTILNLRMQLQTLIRKHIPRSLLTSASKSSTRQPSRFSNLQFINAESDGSMITTDMEHTDNDTDK